MFSTMKKVCIVYHSKTGITEKFAQEIAAFVEKEQYQTQLFSIDSINISAIQNADYLLLGCWTSGLMIFLQHPEKKWVEFAKRIDVSGKKMGLFTTYKLATGSMFRKMTKCINGNATELELKSRNGSLSNQQKEQLRAFLS
jgi:flavodoxin